MSESLPESVEVLPTGNGRHRKFRARIKMREASIYCKAIYRSVLCEYPTREEAEAAGNLALSCGASEKVSTIEDIDRVRKMRKAKC